MHGRTLLAMMALAAGGALATASPVAGGTPPKLVDHPVLERMTLREVNRVRARLGRRPVRIRRSLIEPSREHAAWLVRSGRFRHEGRDGGPFWKRLRAVDAPYPLGEVLATYWACRGPDMREVVRSWMRSPSHRHAILNPSYRTAGVSVLGRTRCGEGVYVMDFAG